jgi:ubiquinone biosynthesis protein
MTIKRDIRDIKRISYVINVLFRNGLGYIVEETQLKYHIPFFKKLMRHKFKPPTSPAVRLRKAFEELGGTYIKLGQLLSIRPDLIPPEYCEELRKLQDDVPPFLFEEAKDVIESELKKHLHQLFSSFSREPLAAASIGQVHKAKLKNGKTVVVKIQRPDIKNTIKADIDILYYLAKKLEKHKKYKSFSPVEIIREFERYTEKELDYTQEARNIDHFYSNFKNSRTIKIPKVYWDYTTDKVLTLEYIDGIKLLDIDRAKKTYDKKDIAKKLVDSVIKQVFEDGFFHADLHPGNVLVLDHKLAFLDFGIVGFLDRDLKEKGLKAFIAVIQKDYNEIIRSLLRIGTITKQTNLEQFKEEVQEVIEDWYGLKLKQVRVTHMLHQLLNICVRNHIRMPVNLILLGKAFVTAEGTCRELDPDFDFVKNTQPYVKKVLTKRMLSAQFIKDFVRRSDKIKEFLYEVPEQLPLLLERIKSGRVHVDIEDSDIRTLSLEIDRSSNRLSYGMLIASLILAGALIVQSNQKPYIVGYPILAAVCFFIALVLGIILLISILKEEKQNI